MILVGLVSVLFSETENWDRKRKKLLELLISFALPPCWWLLVVESEPLFSTHTGKPTRVHCQVQRGVFNHCNFRQFLQLQWEAFWFVWFVWFVPLGLAGGQLLSEALYSSTCLAVTWPSRGDQGSPAGPGACSCAGHATTPGWTGPTQWDDRDHIFWDEGIIGRMWGTDGLGDRRCTDFKERFDCRLKKEETKRCLRGWDFSA